MAGETFKSQKPKGGGTKWGLRSGRLFSRDLNKQGEQLSRSPGGADKIASK